MGKPFKVVGTDTSNENQMSEPLTMNAAANNAKADAEGEDWAYEAQENSRDGDPAIPFPAAKAVDNKPFKLK